MGSHPYEGDELIFTPPDGWGTRATYKAPPDVPRESIVDFYLSEFSETERKRLEALVRMSLVGVLVVNAERRTIDFVNQEAERIIGPPAMTGSDDVGGLVGQNVGTIVASYATGGVTGDYAAGLVGLDYGTITNSYWDTETSGQSVAEPGSGRVDAGVGKTTSELQSPTGYEGIYADWDVDLDDADGDGETSAGADDYWDFRTSSQYPVLKVDFDGGGSASWQEFGTQR